MLKYGPIINIVTNELITNPKIKIPAVLTPKRNPEKPKAVNINPIIMFVTEAMTKVMIINPKYVIRQLNQPISSIASFISLMAKAFDNEPPL